MLNFTRANFYESKKAPNFWIFFQELRTRLFLKLPAKGQRLLHNVIVVSFSAGDVVGAASPPEGPVEISHKELVSETTKTLETRKSATLTLIILFFYLKV